VDGDYNRKTGLVGDGSTKYLNSNRNDNADPRDNIHTAVYVSTASGNSQNYFGVRQSNVTNHMMLAGADGNLFVRSRAETPVNIGANTTGLLGISRAVSTEFTSRRAGATTVNAVTANLTGVGVPHFIFSRNEFGPFANSNARLAFYSIGESLDLALLDARVTDLINAFAAAIP
jgi:hypothetical protein